jgi:hypothetical protein
VAFYRQPRNLGVVGNLNTCLKRTRGELVHLLHGDDAVRPRFYATLEAAFDHAEVGAAFCRFIAMDEAGRWTTLAPLEAGADGIIDDWFDRIAVEQRVQTPTMVVRRALYEELGGFDDRVGGAEDWEMWTRIAAGTRVWHVVEPLALYRIHGDSSSRRSLRVGQNVETLRAVIDLNREVLPPETRDSVTRRALEGTALTAIHRARRFLGAGETAPAKAQVREAIRTSRSPAVLERLLEFAVVAGRRSILRALKRR